MRKSQYDKIKKYKFKRTKLFSIRNMTRIAVIAAIICSVGYSYWNTTLHISGTVTLAGTPPVPTEYDPDNLIEGTNTFNDSPGKPTVTVTNGVVKEYTINDPIDTNDIIIDTGFLPFTNNIDFELFITATFAPADNKTQGGVLFDVSTLNDSSYYRVAYPINSNYPKMFFYNNGKNLNLVDNVADIHVKYVDGAFTTTCNGYTVVDPRKTFSLENISLLIGYTLDTNGDISRRASAIITQFSVKEL